MKILRNIPLVCFALIILILTSVASAKSLEAQYKRQHSQSSISQQKISQPQHLLLNALELKKNGYLAQALAMLSEAYGEKNILITGYYNLIDRKRRIILKEIENGDPWFPGDSGSKKALQSIKNRFKKLQLPEEMANPSMPYEAIALPCERFINYKIIQTVLNKDAQDCLNSPDPWMVSTILFLARKGEVKVSPQDVIRRREGRPDLWDDVTEEQALLYLATLPAEVIRKLVIHNDDIRNVIQSRFKEKDNPLLLQCSFRVDRVSRIIFMNMSIAETEPYESLNRVEISLRDKNGKEFFRAMNNRMGHPAPVPPNAFGVYPVGSKKILTDSDIVDAGHEAATLIKGKYGNLVEGCKTSTAQGILKIHWVVKVSNGALLNDKIFPFVKVVPPGCKRRPLLFLLLN